MNPTNSTTPGNSGAAGLWTRSFTTLILGSAVTMLGIGLSCAGIALLEKK